MTLVILMKFMVNCIRYQTLLAGDDALILPKCSLFVGHFLLGEFRVFVFALWPQLRRAKYALRIATHRV